MKAKLLFILLFAASFLQAQDYVLKTVNDTSFALFIESYNQDSLFSSVPVTGVLDSTEMAVELFRLREQRELGQARQERNALESDREGNSLRIIESDNFGGDYLTYTQDRFGSQFVQAGNLPNFRVRVGAAFYWAKGFITSGLLRFEIVNEDNSVLSPRDLSVIRLESRESFFIPAIDIFGESVDFILEREEIGRRIYYGEKADGTVIRIIQLLTR
jgi:hypothetical protein